MEYNMFKCIALHNSISKEYIHTAHCILMTKIIMNKNLLYFVLNFFKYKIK